jgi:geranylgeranyl diphosphate synthase, type II
MLAQFPIANYLASRRAEVEAALDDLLPSSDTPPGKLHAAMRHSLFAGGKRLRPILTLAANEACGGNRSDAIPAACAVECIHTFSLIHDDLPCMDDDELRRGHPTCHVVFGEAIALLAGDALQAFAFEILASSPCSPPHNPARLVAELSRACGSLALVGGQVLDLEAEGTPVGEPALRSIHLAKTSALLSASLTLWAMVAGASQQQLDALSQFGGQTGLAFQVIDDILDVTQDSHTLGKSAGKDIAAQKATYPSTIGLDASRELAAELTSSAIAALEPFGELATPLRHIAHYLLDRNY